jgi:hypothetical protein
LGTNAEVMAFAGQKVAVTDADRNAVIASISAIERFAGQRSPPRLTFGHWAIGHIAACLVGEIVVVGIEGDGAALSSHALHLGLFVRNKINPE